MSEYFLIDINSGQYSVNSGPFNLPMVYNNTSNFHQLSYDLLTGLAWKQEPNKGFWSGVFPEKPEITLNQRLVESYELDTTNALVNVSYTVEDLNTSEQQEVLENKILELRPLRNMHLQRTDFTQLPDVSLPDDVKSNFATYRSQLRDMFNVTDVTGIVWPELPTGAGIDPDDLFVPQIIF